MARAFKLPDLGEGIHEGEVITVLVSVGDEVKEGDPILEVETDKAAVEIPSPYTGTVLEIMVQPGQVVNVGDVLLTFSDGDKAAEKIETQTASIEADKPTETSPATAPAEAEVPPAAAPVVTVNEAPADRKGPVPASPATRRLARELGVDLHRVTATGPGGLVTAEDVRTFAASGGERGLVEIEETVVAVPLEGAGTAAAVPPLPDFSKWGPVKRMPLRSIRRATAR
ncbi:MAG: hypothetical protein AMJ54_12390, partial [Deltaproteobacteria bacterium SG8_13]